VLPRLLRLTRSAAFRHDGLLRIRRVQSDDPGRVTVELVVTMNGTRNTDIWIVEAEDVCAASIGQLMSGKRFMVLRSHFLIESEVGPSGWLRFSGRPTDLSLLLAALWSGHERIAESWFPLDAFFSSTAPLPKLLASGGGEATGPARLLRAYAAVMSKHGMKVRLKADGGDKRYWWQGSPRRRPPTVHACIINASYIVAGKLSAHKV